MKKIYTTPSIQTMGKLIYKTLGGDPTLTNDAGSNQGGSKPNPNS